MCPRGPDAAALSRVLLYSILKDNPEFLRILLNGERPDYTLEDLGLASWGGDGMRDSEKGGVTNECAALGVLSHKRRYLNLSEARDSK